MANRKILLGILAIALVFGMTVTGCEDDPEDEKDPYVGEWTGTFTVGTQKEEATMALTETEWVLTSNSVNLSGTYAKATIGLNFSMVMNSGSTVVADLKVASGLVVGNLLTVTFDSTLKDYSGAQGNFTRVKETPPPPPTTDPFTGTWIGTLTYTGTPAATIVFSGTNWTLTVGETPAVSGTFTKSSLGLSATLKVAGDVTYGTCSATNEKLTVFFTNGTYVGSRGNFTRPTP